MITINKGTKNKLVVVTSPNCAACKEMQKSNKCEQIPLTRKLVLAPFSATDELSLQAIFKAKDPLKAYKTLLSGQHLNPDDLDWSKDTDAIWKENIDMFDFLTKKYNLQGTPSFFIMDENDNIISQVKLEMEPADVLMFNIKKYQ